MGSLNTSFGHDTTGIDIVNAFPSSVKGKAFVITGTSFGGTGAETAISLAHAHPSHIFLLARSLPKVQPVIDAVSKISPSTSVHFIPTDLSLATIRSAAAQVNRTLGDTPIAALFNSAGGLITEFTLSPELGIEYTLASAYAGHWELTSQLMYGGTVTREDMVVINVASNGHGICAFRPDNVNFDDGTNYAPWAGYGQSKSALMLFSLSLSKRSPAVTSLAPHPGFVADTGATKDLSAEEGKICDETAQRYSGNRFEVSVPKNPQQGCATGLRGALDTEFQKTANGKYLDDCQVAEAYAYARDEGIAARLWELTEGWVGHKFEEPPKEKA
jgi:NAD(P)-dependent dehydrogenase (short-subunit alcohol dehydrogenase family)